MSTSTGCAVSHGAAGARGVIGTRVPFGGRGGPSLLISLSSAAASNVGDGRGAFGSARRLSTCLRRAGRYDGLLRIRAPRAWDIAPRRACCLSRGRRLCSD